MAKVTGSGKSDSLVSVARQVVADYHDHELKLADVKRELKEIRETQGLDSWTEAALFFVGDVLESQKGNAKDWFNLGGSDKENAVALRDRLVEIAAPAIEAEGKIISLQEKLTRQREQFAGLMDRADGDIGKVIRVLAGHSEVWPSRKLKDGSIKPVGFNAVGSAIRPNGADGSKNKEYIRTWDQRYRETFKALESARNAFSYLKKQQAEAAKAAEEDAREHALNSSDPEVAAAAAAEKAERKFTANLAKVGKAIKSLTTVIGDALDDVPYDVETFCMKVAADHGDAIGFVVEEITRLMPVEQLLVREKSAADRDASDPTEKVEG